MQFLAFDLAQAESWIVAHLANEQLMMHALANDDIHCITGSALFNIPREQFNKDTHPKERYVGKKCNHAFAYREGPEVFCADFNKQSLDLGMSLTIREAKKYHAKWHELYNLKGWWSSIEDELSKSRQLTTPYGRKRTFHSAWGKLLFNEATAHVPQSTVADHVLGAIQEGINERGGLLAIMDWCLHNSCTLVHTAYDSAMIEIPINRESEIAPVIYKMLYRPLMINGIVFSIPVDCEVGDRWGETIKYKIAS